MVGAAQEEEEGRASWRGKGLGATRWRVQLLSLSAPCTTLSWVTQVFPTGFPWWRTKCEHSSYERKRDIYWTTAMCQALLGAFICMVHIHAFWKKLLLSPFYKWSNRGLKRFRDLPKMLTSWTRVCLTLQRWFPTSHLPFITQLRKAEPFPASSLLLPASSQHHWRLPHQMHPIFPSTKLRAPWLP